MTLATRIIPVLLKRGPQLVKGERFNAWRSVGVAMQAARVHAARAVDELIILDIGATPENRAPDFAAVRELTRDCFCPLAVGGGVKTLEDIRQLLEAGADKVVIGAAAQDGNFIRRAANRFGSQAITVIVDHDEQHNVKSHIRALSWAMEMQYWGAGEILLQAKERDGTMRGYDIELIGIVSHALDIPIIACGGCSGPENMLAAVQAGASAVAAGALFQFSDITPRQCSEYLAQKGVETRLPA